MACGGKVRQLTRREAGMLRLSILDQAPENLRAFACGKCEVLLYEDELTFGKFVPPQLKGYLLSKRAWPDG